MKLKKCTFIRGGGELSARLLVLSVAMAAFGDKAVAEDLTVATGESATISAAARYGTMTIDGDLTVTGGEKVSVTNIFMNGGSITISGNDSTLGKAHGGSNEPDKTYLYMTNDANGAYGKIHVKDTGVDADTGLAISEFHICQEGENFVSDNGYFDFLSLESGTANFFAVYNHSSCTGRITVTGNSAIYRRQPRYSKAIFRSGAYKINLVDNATLGFRFSAQGGYLNDSGCVVDVGGSGNVYFEGTYGDTDYTAEISKGAYLNHTGPVEFQRTDNKRHCYFALNDSSVIGPNVTALKQISGSSTFSTQIKIANGAAVSLCGDVEITGARAFLTGGKIKIDATDASRSFKCNIKAGDTLVVEKVGENEMVVSSTTNIPNLVVSEGTVRFEGGDCVVSNLTTVSGATLIADGCTVTVLSDAEFVGASFLAKNGGRFVKSGQSRTVIYDPVSVTGGLHVADGELVFSKYGFDQKFWRWTFFSVKNGPKSLRHRGLYLFGTDGAWQSFSVSYDSTSAKYDNPPTTPLAANKCRWWIHSETNIVKDSSYSYCSLNYLPYWFHYEKAGNNLATLSSPVIDPENPKSHVGVEVRLPSTSLPITGYNMRTHSSTYYANGWKLEASSNGLDWEIVDIRSNQTFNIGGTYYSYDNVSYTKKSPNTKEFFRFTGYRHGGLAVMDPLSVQVDEDATLDLLAFDDGQPIDAITIDFASGAGTVKGGKIVANGTLTLLNVEENGVNLDDVLPIIFDGTKGTENFASWTVFVDGRKIRRKISYSDRRITVPPTGLVIMVK